MSCGILRFTANPSITSESHNESTELIYHMLLSWQAPRDFTGLFYLGSGLTTADLVYKSELVAWASVNVRADSTTNRAAGLSQYTDRLYNNHPHSS